MAENFPRVRQSIGLWVWMNVLQERSYSDILRELKRLSDELAPELLGGEGLSIQLHLGPEARRRGRKYAYETDRPVFLDDLAEGIKKGIYPPAHVLNMPFWGPGRENGVILNPDVSRIREWQEELHEVVQTAEKLSADTSEPLAIIICPGRDEFRSNRVDFEDAWKRFDEFLLPVVKSTDLTFILEWQTRQEGPMGVFPTPQMAIEWSHRFNDQVGRRAMGVLPHFAQSLSVGLSIADTVRMIRDAGLFFGWVHVNGGPAAPYPLVDEINAVRRGDLLASDVPFAPVLDVPPGIAGKENSDLLEEQRNGLAAAAEWLAANPSQTLYVGQCWRAWTENPFEEVKQAVLAVDGMLRATMGEAR